MGFETRTGNAFPLGCTWIDGGVQFALYSKNSTAVTLCLFNIENRSSIQEIVLDPKSHRTGDVWHIWIRGLQTPVDYGYKVEGPYHPEEGLLFKPEKIVSDPYARALNTPSQWQHDSLRIENFHPLGRLLTPEVFDWEDDAHPRHPMEELIIYELHVRAMTQDPSSGVQRPGSFLGLVEKIPYLKHLGVNAVELMPIHEFNERENPQRNPKTNEPLCNLWGYSTVNFFSPMNRYTSSNTHGAAIAEFKMLVKAFHKAGIEVILDVVYNHTAEEESWKEKYYSFRGIDNSTYYFIDQSGKDINYSGCGNSLNCNHPAVAEMILDSLRYWVSEMHVDGFRFDLASILTRGEDGEPMAHPLLIDAISKDPILAEAKLIAEPWDATGLYQVGSFPGGGRWAEWNGKYRDCVRRFLKGTDGQAGEFATRICGSEDLYGVDRTPCHSINFIVSHDGYTLKDLVSYQQKYNFENGQDNLDGFDDNMSWNCGVEGPTDDPAIAALRERQMKNFHLALMVSQGTPMIVMGDEYAHTRYGNNNAWCQDNRLSWFLWDMLPSNIGFERFYRLLIHFRKQHPQFRKGSFLSKDDIIWHGLKPLAPDWSFHSRFIAFTIDGLYVAFNANFYPIELHLPELAIGKTWRRIIDTSQPSPEDFIEDPLQGPAISLYKLESYSALVCKVCAGQE